MTDIVLYYFADRKHTLLSGMAMGWVVHKNAHFGLRTTMCLIGSILKTNFNCLSLAAERHNSLQGFTPRLACTCPFIRGAERQPFIPRGLLVRIISELNKHLNPPLRFPGSNVGHFCPLEDPKEVRIFRIHPQRGQVACQ